MVDLPNIRTEERRNVLGAFITLFGALAAHVVTETARDAIFLTRVPVAHLPWMYLAIAVVAAFLVRPRDRERHVGRHLLGWWLVVSAGVDVAFWLLGTNDRPWVSYLLYVWSGVFGTLTLTWFWLLLGELFTVTEAKRLYGFIGAGSVLGAVAGSGIASGLAQVLPTRFMLLGAAVLLLMTAAVPALVIRRPADGAPRAAAKKRERRRKRVKGSSLGRGGMKATRTVSSARAVNHDPYVKRLALFVVVSTVALSLVDYVFKATVADAVPKRDLASWLANFYLVLNAIALVAQVLLTGAVMRRLGVHRAVLFLPFLIVGGGVGVLIGGGFTGALLLKGADGGLRYSLHRTSVELLYLPIPERLRRRVKSFIDVLLQRSAQAAASVLILVMVGLGAGMHALGVAIVVLAGLWFVNAIALRGYYLDMFRATLRAGSLETRRELRDLDLSSLEVLIRALNHDDPEVLAAMDILAREKRTHLIPALVLYHPNDEIVLRALEHFAAAGVTDFVPVADRVLADGRADVVRAAALRARQQVSPDPEQLRRYLDDGSPLVRITALAGLLAAGELEDAARDAALAKLRAVDDAAERIAALTAIATQPLPEFEPVVLALAESDDREVRLAAADAMGALGTPGVRPALIAMVGQQAARLRARAAIVKHGPPALATLREALWDEDLPLAVRIHVPRTISRFRSQEAADILLERLLEEPKGAVAFKILRGLGGLAADVPRVQLDRPTLRKAVERELALAFELMHREEVLASGVREDPARDTTGHELLATLVHDKLVHCKERVFRLLGLLHRDEDFESIYRSTRSGSRSLRSTGRELLEHVLAPELREPVVALVSDDPLEERLAAGAGYHDRHELGYDALVRALVAGESEALATIAAYHAGELGLSDVAAPLPSPLGVQQSAPPTRRRGLMAAFAPRRPAHAG